MEGGSELGACEWIWGPCSLGDVLRALVGVGCSGIELSGEPDREDRDGLADALSAQRIVATGITAICPWPSEERDLAHPDRERGRAAVDYYRRCVDLAAEVDAPTIGLIPTAVGRVGPLSSFEEERRRAVERARRVAAYAGERGIGVGIEAVNRYESFLVNTANDALAFAEDVGRANVGVILDAYHMNIEEHDAIRAVSAAGSKIRCLHLADSNRRGLGHGHLAIRELIAAAVGSGFRGPVVFEFTAPGWNPFRARGGTEAFSKLEGFLQDSVSIARAALASTDGAR
jgi:D-psicose/D-tagatose/L-ribulose 3-epimerase